MRHPMMTLLAATLLLSACGAGETAATASLQARQAEQALQQKAALQEQINSANAASAKRLEQVREATQ